MDRLHLLEQALSAPTKEQTGLTLEQAVLLCRLELLGGQTTVGSLAVVLSRTSQSVTSRLNGLERRGLVARRRNPHTDRRRVSVQLTPAGAAGLARYRSAAEAIAGRFLDPSNREVVVTFTQAAAAMLDLLEQ